MPAKKAARSRKTVAKTAVRKAPAPRKTAKPAARKPKSTSVRVKPAKPAKPAKAVKAVKATRAAPVHRKPPPAWQRAATTPRRRTKLPS